MALWIHLLLLISSLTAATGQILLKQGATGRTDVLSFANGWVAGGLLFYGVGTAIWVFALSKAPLSLVYPYTAITFVLVFLSGAALFGETIGPRAVIGAGLVLTGIVLINLR
jgi:multidrug transporter EmrE-like cation transporter